MNTTTRRPELAAFALSALAVVAYVVLALAGKTQPGWLEVIAVGGLAGGSGLAIPTAATASAQLDELHTLLEQHAQAHTGVTS